MTCSTDIVLLNKKLHKKGGLEKYTRELAKAFCREGANVSVLTTDKPQGDEPYKVITIPGKSSLSFRSIKQFDSACRSYLKNSTVPIVFGMDRNSYQTHYRAGGGVHKAYLASRDEGFLKKLSFKWNPLHRIILDLEKKTYQNPLTKKIFVNSDMVRSEVIKHYDTDPEKIVVVHNGVEWEELGDSFAQAISQRSYLLSKRGLDPLLHQFLFVGHGYKRKGLDPLLEALASITHRKWHLTLIGKEKKISFYKQKAEELGLKNRVTFLGPVDNVVEYLSVADSLVIPSYYDPFANVTVEALAMGVFVVSSLTNGGHEILTPKNGATFDLKDPKSLLQALNTALLHSKSIDSAQEIRMSVKHLDFKNQLSQVVTHTLKDAS